MKNTAEPLLHAVASPLGTRKAPRFGPAGVRRQEKGANVLTNTAEKNFEKFGTLFTNILSGKLLSVDKGRFKEILNGLIPALDELLVSHPQNERLIEVSTEQGKNGYGPPSIAWAVD